MTQRAIAQAFLALQTALTLLLAVAMQLEGNTHAGGAWIGALIYAACLVAYRRGWEPARQVAVVTLTLLLVFATREPYLTERTALAVFVPPVVALMLTSPGWIVGSALIEFAGLGIRSDFRFLLRQPLELLVFVMGVSGLVLARRSMDSAMARLAAHAQRADSARLEAESRTREAVLERDRATKLEADLLHAQRLESIGRLAGGVAHDFNNLLTVIGASASMAERSARRGASPADDLHEIQLAVRRASELTKQLLAFARKQLLVKRTLELNALVSNVERMLRRLIGEGVTLTARLWPERLVVDADAGQLEQVIMNLVINARDAVAGGRGEITLETMRLSMLPGQLGGPESAPGGDYACVEISDTGVGMSEEVLSRLFEPFFTTKGAGRGTGLGLATSFGIVRQHDGFIRVETELGKGTTMRVLLPLSLGREATLPVSEVLPIAGGRKRVLVVEDEPQVRAIAARALSNAGYEVLQAENGAAALTLLAELARPVDALVTDVVMPELSGLQLAKAACERQPDLGLVFMSGYPEPMQGMEVGAFVHAGFLAKPFSPNKLVEAVAEQLERRSARMARA